MIQIRADRPTAIAAASRCLILPSNQEWDDRALRARMPRMSEAVAAFKLLRQSTEAEAASALEALVRDGPDEALNRINALDFAARHGLDEEQAIACLLHASRLGLFDLSWNVLCPGCGGVLDSRATLRTIQEDSYHCALCAAGYEPTLDETVEVTFTVSSRTRRIAAHDPDGLPLAQYFRQIFWGSGFDVPEDFESRIAEVTLEAVELAPGEKAILSFQLPAAFVIIFDPVTHATQFLDVQGEPTSERRPLNLVINQVRPPSESLVLQPGPVRLTVENRTPARALPSVWLAGDALHEVLGRRKPFLTAKRLLTNQIFRDLFRADTLDLEQHFRITSLTFLFTDLKGSTELYERIGDLAAYDLVRSHFDVLHGIVAAEAGAIVKTIGDAVMATFPTPDRAVAAALRMRGAMDDLNAGRPNPDLILKIGIHEGPCLAVTLNDRQDYFGQTVNIASRVQGLAFSSSIFATGRVIEDSKSARLLERNGLSPQRFAASLRGIASDVPVYEIPQ